MAGYRDLPLDCKVYVGNLGSNITKEDITYAFEKIGPLRDVWIAFNPPGFAFIHFEHPCSVDDAVSQLDGTELCGSIIRVDRGRTRRQRREPRYERRYSRSRSPRSRYGRNPKRSRSRSVSPRKRRGRRDGYSTRSRSPRDFNSRSRSRSPIKKADVKEMQEKSVAQDEKSLKKSPVKDIGNQSPSKTREQIGDAVDSA